MRWIAEHAALPGSKVFQWLTKAGNQVVKAGT